MNASARPVLLASCDNSLVDPLCLHLRRADIIASVVGTATELAGLAPLGKYPLMLVDDTVLDPCGFVSLKRELGNPSMLSAVLMDQSRSPEERYAAYRSGATLCLTKPCDPRELAMLAVNLVALEHSGRRQPAVYEEEWQLRRDGWRLRAPGGAEAKLTFREFTVLEELASARPNVAPKEVLLVRLGCANDLGGHKALEAVVGSIRAKTEKLGSRRLLSSEYGVGWSLSSPMRIL
ncbi:response regulator transcription factor [Chlorobium sp. N1]|uniref:response regulator transcription factor n=1 Tax=Chlorobium sp. N1 TaxID=2491138 RepID=UPI00103CF8CB|nr:response regulator transcription factor [Chlorobium sp. N1]TCD47936.1 response regulator transcription factor [Chlorobium sp. N1]